MLLLPDIETQLNNKKKKKAFLLQIIKMKSKDL